jgi:hypothetical protein
MAAATEKASTKPYCFVIGPYGKADSEIRRWSDDLFNGLIQPIAAECGYDCHRLIDDTRPGDITDQIIQKLMESDLVIADLTAHNPNVFYELAVRHATGKDFILLQAPSDLKIPFDITVMHVITVENTIIGARRAREELTSQITKIKKKEASFENPITRYRDRLAIKKDGTPQEKMLSDLKDQIGSLVNIVQNQEKKIRHLEQSQINTAIYGTPPLGSITTSGSGVPYVVPGTVGTFGTTGAGGLYGTSGTLGAVGGAGGVGSSYSSLGLGGGGASPFSGGLLGTSIPPKKSDET